MEGIAGTRSAIGVTGADLDLCAIGESAAGKVLVAKEEGGLMADVRLLDGEVAVFSLVELMRPFPPFIWVRTEFLSNFVPLLAGGDGGGDETLLLLRLSLLEVSTFPMRVVRTVFMGEPFAAVVAGAAVDDGDGDSDAMWFRLPVDPREDRF